MEHIVVHIQVRLDLVVLFKFPAFAKTIKLAIVKFLGLSKDQRLEQSCRLNFLLVLLTSSQRLMGAPSFLRIIPNLIHVP